MNGHPFAFSSAPLRRVDAVQFGILSPDEIVRMITPCVSGCTTIITKQEYVSIESNVCRKGRIP
jgi:hypothetical protein